MYSDVPTSRRNRAFILFLTFYNTKDNDKNNFSSWIVLFNDMQWCNDETKGIILFSRQFVCVCLPTFAITITSHTECSINSHFWAPYACLSFIHHKLWTMQQCKLLIKFKHLIWWWWQYCKPLFIVPLFPNFFPL